nr:PREDICTED: cathepsin L 2-like [Bemisia tabaci]
MKLSEQQLIDCTEAPNQKCNGGYLPPAFDVMIKPGLQLAKDYPYLAKNGTCKKNIKPAVKLKDYIDVSDKMDAALPTSPLAVCMTVVWEVMFYIGGVLAPKTCPNDWYKLNHDVVCIGMCGDAWLLRNSWGTKWGVEGGHFYVKKGFCGIGIESYKLVP